MYFSHFLKYCSSIPPKASRKTNFPFYLPFLLLFPFLSSLPLSFLLSFLISDRYIFGKHPRALPLCLWTTGSPRTSPEDGARSPPPAPRVTPKLLPLPGHQGSQRQAGVSIPPARTRSSLPLPAPLFPDSRKHPQPLLFRFECPAL